MSISIKLRCYNTQTAADFVLFSETTPGHFGTDLGSPTTDVTASNTSGSPLQVVAVPKVAGKVCSWQRPSSGATVTNYGLLSATASSSASGFNLAYEQSTSGRVSVTVIDAHGTHTGLPTGTTSVPNTQTVGVFHKTTADGYTFTGWKVTFLRGTLAQYHKFISTFSSGEATTSGNETTVSKAYSESYAVVVKLGQSSTDTVTFEAQYVSQSTGYTLKYAGLSGASPSSYPDQSGTTFTLKGNPTKTSWTFDGWEIHDGSESGTVISTNKLYKGDSFTPPAGSSATIYAVATWRSSATIYTLYYDTTSLSGASPDHYTSQSGTTFTLKGNPTKASWKFAGWEIHVSSPSGTVVARDLYGGSTFTPSGTVLILYAVAKWLPSSYTLKYAGLSGASPSSYPDQSGASFKLSGTPTKSGEDFVGWKIRESSEYGKIVEERKDAGTTFTPPSGSTVLTYYAVATWSTRVYTLNYDTNGGSPSSYPQQTGSSFVLSGPPTKYGSDFLGWTIHASSSSGTVVASQLAAGSSYTPDTSVLILYAVAEWGALVSHTLTYLSGYDGGTPPAPVSDLLKGDTVTLAPAMSRVGHTFSRWRIDPDGVTVAAGGSYTMPDSDVTATAMWNPSRCTLTYMSGYDAPSYGSVTADADTVITLMGAKTRQGFNFVGWLVEDQTDDERTQRLYSAGASYLVRSDGATATAQWSPVTTYVITYDKNATGVSGDPIPDALVSERHQTRIQDAELWSRPGYTFRCWNTLPGGGGTTYRPYDFVFPKTSMTLYAVWDEVDITGAEASYHWQNGPGEGKQQRRINVISAYYIAVMANVPSGSVRYGCRSSGVWRWEQYGKVVDHGGPESDTERVAQFGTTITVSSPGSASLWKNAIFYTEYPGDGKDTTYYGENYIDESWVFEATNVDGYVFKGWYTLPKSVSYSAPTDDILFSALVSKNAKLTLGDVVAGVNSNCTYYSHTYDGTTSSEKGDYTNYIFAKFAPISMLVLLDAGDGETDPFFMEVTYKSKYGWLPSPGDGLTVPDGMTFDGWYTAPTGGSKVTAATVCAQTEDHTLYARYSGSPTVIVQFDGNGGTPSYPSRSYSVGSSYGSLPSCSRAGYALDGWYTALYGGTKVVTATTVVRMSPQVLYAHWTESGFTIIFNPNGGSVSRTSTYIPPGSPITVLPYPTKDGSSFVGWFTAASGGSEVTVSTVPTSNMTVYAHWSSSGGSPGGATVVERGYGYVVWSVILNANGGTVSKVAIPVVPGDPVGAIPVPTKTGGTFSGWFTAASGGTRVTDTTVPTGDITIYAHWE